MLFLQQQTKPTRKPLQVYKPTEFQCFVFKTSHMHILTLTVAIHPEISHCLKACDVTLLTNDSKLGSPCEAFSLLAQMHNAFLVSKAPHCTEVPRVDAGNYGNNRIPQA